MLNIFYNLAPFFEDCYRRINVREYAKILKISPPTASKFLHNYHKEGILKREVDRNYIFFYANKDSKSFIDLSRIYWSYKLGELIDIIEKKIIGSAIILFGSLSKGESKIDSDIDIAIFSQRKELDIENFEKKLKRKIQLFWFKSINDVESKELSNNIINGYVLKGRLKL